MCTTPGSADRRALPLVPADLATAELVDLARTALASGHVALEVAPRVLRRMAGAATEGGPPPGELHVTAFLAAVADAERQGRDLVVAPEYLLRLARARPLAAVAA